MAQELPANVKVLRLFGIEQAAVENALRTAAEQSAVQVQTLHKGGETLVVLQAADGDEAACSAVFSRLTLRVKAACAGALYGEGSTTLPEAALAALKQGKKLFVCADEPTARLMTQRLDGLPGAEAVYDFGDESCLHEKLGPRIARAAKRGADPVQQAAARIRQAYKLSGADWAVAQVPVGNGESWLLVGDKKGVWVRRIAATDKPALWLLDMLRRAALGLEQAPGTEWVRRGEALPAVGADALHPGWEPAPQPAAGSAERWPAPDPDDLDPDEADPDAGEDLAPEDAAPSRGGAGRGLLALVIVLVLAAAAAALLWWAAGGDVASFWSRSGLEEFTGKNAALL